MAVLLGHTAPVSFLDFHPSLPDALLSCSLDGSVRLWRARDPGEKERKKERKKERSTPVARRVLRGDPGEERAGVPERGGCGR